MSRTVLLVVRSRTVTAMMTVVIERTKNMSTLKKRKKTTATFDMGRMDRKGSCLLVVIM
jgi:hypothetical protein